MITLGLSLLWSAVQATLIGIVAVALGARPWRVGGAFTPLLALLLIALITVCSFLPLPGWWPNTQVAQADLMSTATQSASTEPALVSQPFDESIEVVDRREASPAPAPASTLLGELAANFVDELKSVRNQADQRWTRSSIPLWVVGVFAIGVAIGLVRLVLGVLGVRDIRHSSLIINDQSLSELLDILQAELGLKSKVELRQAKELTSAATVGYFAPAILLPEHWRSWQPEELRAVLGHELAHIHHQDFAAQFLAQLGLVLHFYNPIVHWLSERMKLEQELAADAVAAGLAGGQRQYLRVLATLALDHQNQIVGWPARAFLPTRHSFLRRLEMLRVMKAPPARPAMAGRLGAVVLMVLLTIGLVTLRPESGMRVAKASDGPVAVVQTNATEPATPLAQDANTVNGQAADYELRYLGEDVELVGGLRPVELLKSRQVKEVYDAFGSSLSKEFERVGVKLEEVEQAVIGFVSQNQPMNSVSLYVRLTKPLRLDAQKVQGQLIELNGRSAIETPQGTVYWQPDERSLVINSRRQIERFIAGRVAALPFANSGAWSKVKHEPAFALMTGKLARQLEPMRNGGAVSPQMQISVSLASCHPSVYRTGPVIRKV